MTRKLRNSITGDWHKSQILAIWKKILTRRIFRSKKSYVWKSLCAVEDNFPYFDLENLHQFRAIKRFSMLKVTLKENYSSHFNSFLRLLIDTLFSRNEFYWLHFRHLRQVMFTTYQYLEILKIIMIVDWTLCQLHRCH